MQTATFIMVLWIQVACKGKELCEVFPRSQNIRYGSDLTVSLKALPHSDCRNKTAFNTSRVYWTINNQRIAKRFYDFNSTFASVSIRNVSLAKGTIECLLDYDVLDGSIFRSYYVLSNPQNVSCVGKIDFVLIKCNITCKWDLDHADNTNYTVFLEQGSKVATCKSREKSCTFDNENDLILYKNINITVTAENPVGKTYSEKVTYVDVWSIGQIDPPDVRVKLGLSDLRVSWNNNFPTDCKVHFADHEKGSFNEPVKVTSESNNLLMKVKPCTNYTITVCCKLNGSIWSTCSQNITVLTNINVSDVQLYLWRSKSVLSHKGKRTVHLMWKGVPPSCRAFDEYRLFDHIYNSTFTSLSFKPSQNHTFITLDENSHRMSVAIFCNDTYLSEASIDIPSTAEDLDLPPLHNVSILTKNGQIHVTWDKPVSAVSGYIIVWNTTDKDHLWQQSQETRFSLKGEPFILYTISVSPIYEAGPGPEVRLEKYIQEGMPPKVSEVSVKWISDKKAEIQWVPALHTECCAFVVNYTVIYKTRDDLTPKNVTVSKKQRSVILDDLHPSTVYSVCVAANSMASSSHSEDKTFSTNPHGEGSFTTLITCCVGLALLPVLVILSVMIQRKYLSEKFPNPRFSSLPAWSSQNHRMPWNSPTMPWTCDSEETHQCQLDTEESSISSTSRRDLKLRASQNLTAQNVRNETENKVVATSPITMDLPSGGKQETTLLFRKQPSAETHTPTICPLHFSQFSYRNQSPLMSPGESPRKGWVKPSFLEETELLLRAKLQNASVDTTYVTVDTFEHGKDQSK